MKTFEQWWIENYEGTLGPISIEQASKEIAKAAWGACFKNLTIDRYTVIGPAKDFNKEKYKPIHSVHSGDSIKKKIDKDIKSKKEK